MTLDAVTIRRLLALVALTLLLALAACTTSDAPTTEATPTAEASPASTDATPDLAIPYRQQLTLIEQVVIAWGAATNIEEAHAAAETAANLVVGPAGPKYGDRDGNGTVSGETNSGILPGLDGSPIGLANPLAANECIVRDVLGGDWEDPAVRWTTMLTAIDEWRPDHNTMPTLPSHPMRVVGWATFTLASDSLDEAHEYAGHAQLHVNVSRAALDC